jgi:hypothetical protein
VSEVNEQVKQSSSGTRYQRLKEAARKAGFENWDNVGSLFLRGEIVISRAKVEPPVKIGKMRGRPRRAPQHTNASQQTP